VAASGAPGGRRFVNESAPYVDAVHAVHAMYAVYAMYPMYAGNAG